MNRDISHVILDFFPDELVQKRGKFFVKEVPDGYAIFMIYDFTDDFRDMIMALNDNNVDFMIMLRKGSHMTEYTNSGFELYVREDQLEQAETIAELISPEPENEVPPNPKTKGIVPIIYMMLGIVILLFTIAIIYLS